MKLSNIGTVQIQFESSTWSKQSTTYDDKPVYKFDDDETVYYLYWKASFNQWFINTVIGENSRYMYNKVT